MPASLKSLTSKTSPLLIDFGDGDTINLVYRTYAYDAILEDKVVIAAREMRRAQAVNETAVAVIESWDFKADAKDKNPIPLTLEALAKVPMQIMEIILEKIREDRSPDPTTGQSSNGLSETGTSTP